MEISNKNKIYGTDNHLVFSCQYHVVFCPKYRRKVFDQEEIVNYLRALLNTKIKEYNSEILEMEVMSDHVHLLINSNPKYGILKIIKGLKGYTSNRMRKKFKSLKTRLPCLWSRNKFVSTAGEVSLETVKKYIENQKNV